MSKSTEELAAIMLSGYFANPNLKHLNPEIAAKTFKKLCDELEKVKTQDNS